MSSSLKFPVWAFCSITDAANETKDKVKYLEALRRHFEHLYHGASPADIMNTALPGLASSVKQMDSISRFYARSGYLGLLFTKVGRERGEMGNRVEIFQIQLILSVQI